MFEDAKYDSVVIKILTTTNLDTGLPMDWEAMWIEKVDELDDDDLPENREVIMGTPPYMPRLLVNDGKPNLISRPLRALVHWSDDMLPVSGHSLYESGVGESQ